MRGRTRMPFSTGFLSPSFRSYPSAHPDQSHHLYDVVIPELTQQFFPPWDAKMTAYALNNALPTYRLQPSLALITANAHFNFNIVVCFDTSRIYARCAAGLRTVDIAVSPVCKARILFLCEFCTTKKKPTHSEQMTDGS